MPVTVVGLLKTVTHWQVTRWAGLQLQIVSDPGGFKLQHHHWSRFRSLISAAARATARPAASCQWESDDLKLVRPPGFRRGAPGPGPGEGPGYRLKLKLDHPGSSESLGSFIGLCWPRPTAPRQPLRSGCQNEVFFFKFKIYVCLWCGTTIKFEVLFQGAKNKL
jgi:hypothetical protein